MCNKKIMKFVHSNLFYNKKKILNLKKLYSTLFGPSLQLLFYLTSVKIIPSNTYYLKAVRLLFLR